MIFMSLYISLCSSGTIFLAPAFAFLFPLHARRPQVARLDGEEGFVRESETTVERVWMKSAIVARAESCINVAATGETAKGGGGKGTIRSSKIG